MVTQNNETLQNGQSETRYSYLQVISCKKNKIIQKYRTYKININAGGVSNNGYFNH